MMTLKNILVATDFSRASEAALVYARELTHTFGGTLRVLHVAGNIAASAIGVEGYTTDFIALQGEVEEAARKQLDGLVSEADRRTLSVKTVVLTSNSPAQSIVSYAKDAHIDLVVVGTYGLGGMAHMLMGNVAERVVRMSPCPVLTVRHPAYDSKSPEADQVAANASP